MYIVPGLKTVCVHLFTELSWLHTGCNCVIIMGFGLKMPLVKEPFEFEKKKKCEREIFSFCTTVPQFVVPVPFFKCCERFGCQAQLKRGDVGKETQSNHNAILYNGIECRDLKTTEKAEKAAPLAIDMFISRFIS